jgi:extracellular elastinolytic metalloproteinase
MPHPHQHVPEDFHALYDMGVRAARRTSPRTLQAVDTAGHRRLAADVPDVQVDYDDATHLPNRVSCRTPTAPLSRTAAASPDTAARAFIEARRDLWEMTADDAANVDVVAVSQQVMPTVRMIQHVEGKEVFGSDVTVTVSPDNRVMTVAGMLFPGTGARDTRSRARTAPTIPAEAAIAQAALDLTGLDFQVADFAPATTQRASGAYRFYQFQPQAHDTRSSFERDVRVKEVMFPMGEGTFVPGYYVELFIKGFPAFSYVIDAIDAPEVLYRKNLTATVAFRYRVHNTGDAIFRPEDGPAPGTPHPTGLPDGFQAEPIPEQLVEIESLLPGRPWLPDDAETTHGNNCLAYADLRGPDGLGPGDVIGRVSSPRTFDYSYDHSKPASDPTNLQNSIVGMFFHVNWLHDRWYEAGFDEASGNAQASNAELGGEDGDPVLAEGHDFSGTDNANMATPADGASPRMQMFEFVGMSPLPSRTSNHEALITFHEMGHYVTNRLVGNANGLTNVQGRAMGEGWGDFFAICMTSQATDDFDTGVFAVGGWTDFTSDFKDNYYFSIRRYPYSAAMHVNPLTFKHISSGVVLPAGVPRNPVFARGPNNEVHNAGEVWCAALWEVFVNLVGKHGHAEAERRMLRYVINGLKLTPSRPTYTQARDGIISAITFLDNDDLAEAWAGFAKRGMGVDAVSPPSSSVSLAGVVESFETP